MVSLKHIILLFAVLVFTSAYSQKYNTIGGVRIGDDFGISFAQRIANKTTVELNLQPGTFVGKQMSAVLVKQHYPLLTKRLNFFMGGGLYSRKTPQVQTDVPQAHRSSGLALSFGAEITLGRLSISTDYLPLVTFSNNGSNQRFYTTSGVSLRYVFVERESSTKKFLKNIFKRKK